MKLKVLEQNFIQKIIIVALFAYPLAHAQNISGQNQDSRPELIEQEKILDSIRQYVKKDDLTQIRNLYFVVQSAEKTITEKGTTHRESIQSMQRVVMVYRYSERFLQSIKCSLSEKGINRLGEITRTLATRHGFETVQGANILETMLIQMKSLITQLINLSTSTEMKTALENLRSQQEGIAEATSKQGDRPRAFDKAKEVYYALRNLYEPLLAVKNSDDFQNSANDLIYLNEQLGSYAQVEVQAEVKQK